MSRYSKTIINESGEVKELNWGFDHTLGYWYDISNPMLTEDMNIREEWSTAVNGGSRSTMLEFLIRYDLPEEHRSMVGLDMEF